jgi:regulation of enolase protein 1 (concanavalin A-like superfamily)
VDHYARGMSTGMVWLNEPGVWSDEDGVVRVVTESKTDFWRRTFYDWTTDNGHFYHRTVTGDFTADVTVAAGHTALFDQAGLMVRADERNWLKTGLELTSGAVHVSTVVTRDFSDLSTVPLPRYTGELALRVTRFGSALAVHVGEGAGRWRLARLGYLDLPAAVQVGLMCCSPEGAALEATFTDFRVGEPISREGLE